MDITPLFKACVKTVRTRNKAFGLPSDNLDKNRILKNKPKHPFLSKARDVTSQITRLRDFLLENRSAYLHFSNFINARGVEMTDVERDQIDDGSQRIINSCSHVIQEFKREARQMKAEPQMLEFMDNVLRIIENYLKNVCSIHTEQKALRVKRALDMRKLSKLEIENKKDQRIERKKSEDMSEEFVPSVSGKSKDIDAKDSSSVNNKNTMAIVNDMDSSITTDDDQLSPEEMQIFESENIQLYNELNSLSDEVRQIESKVLHIAELQEAFTEKVLQQDQDVDRIAGTVMGVNENVRDANEQIRQAIQRNAGVRFWVLFFLLVMSFTLLFLDWYNE